MVYVNKAVDKITLAMTAISGVLFAIIVLIMLVNIIGRSFFHAPVKGTVELVQYGVMLCAGFVMCRSTFEDKHIIVTFIIDRFPHRLRSFFVTIGRLTGVVAFGALTFLNYRNIPVAIAANKVTDSFRAPFEYIYIAMTICFAIGTLIFLYQFCLGVARIFEKKPASGGTNS
jgi:TRAP-type C4-dicarboxylate transport system permease small subunit